MSYRGLTTDIISIAQQARPNVAGNIAFARPQFSTLSRRVVTSASATCSSRSLPSEGTSGRRVHANFAIEQVTLNFVINAHQAIEGVSRSNGRILIRAQRWGIAVASKCSTTAPG